MDYRNTRNLYLLLLISLIITQPMVRGQSVYTAKKVVISPAPDYNLSTVASGKLTWPEGKQQFITLNLTVELLPDTLSKMEVPLIAFTFIASIGGEDRRIGEETNTPDIILSNTNTTVLFNQTLLPPNEADRFYFNISLFIRSVGNVTQAQANKYVIRFPDVDSDTTTILVDRDRIVPLINIYGFPPDSFFQKWLPIYGVTLLLLVSPAIGVGISKLSRSPTRQIETITEKEDEELNE